MTEEYAKLREQLYRESDLKHLLYNTCTDSSGHHFIRILKSFKTSEVLDCSVEEETFLQPPLIRNFSLRFYIPKEPLSLKGSKDGNSFDPKIKHLVVMVNGLNEILDSHFHFYDFLGSHFTERGIGAVLLSTPYHLHRVANKSPVDSKRPIFTPHERFKNPLDYFMHFKIASMDIERLIRNVKQIDNKNDSEDFNFYENHFNKDVKVTVLGYSLGGLISLGTLLRLSEKGEDELIDSCILYNAAPKLASATTDRIGIENDLWREVWEKFASMGTDTLINQNNKNNEAFAYFFKDLYMGMRGVVKGSLTKKIIHRNSKKMLLVMSGSDDIIDTKAWDDYLEFTENERQKTIINKFIFAGVGHSPMNEAQGAESLPRVMDVMTDHILKNQKSHWQDADIVEKIRPLIINTKYYHRVLNETEQSYINGSFDREAMKKLLDEFDLDKKNEFLRMYYLSKIYYPKFQQLVKKIKRSDRTRKSKKMS